ncbi:MAG TPA: hypothetical protein VKU00_04555 [Chthonomonadaceae bacterium]|nr:hypothetical protein [Chthonomonadaceae bacterium]
MDGQIHSLWQSELAISREDAKRTRFQLAEAKRQLEALRSHNAQLESERKCQKEIVAKALAALSHEMDASLFSIAGSAESALERLAALQEGGCAEAGDLTLRLESILEGAEQIRKIVAMPPATGLPG